MANGLFVSAQYLKDTTMAHASNSNTTVLADLTAACTLDANADFGTPPLVITNTPGIAVAGVGGVVRGTLPDTIMVDTTAGTVIVLLPKIGTQACPVGSTVAIRRHVANANLVTVTAHVAVNAADATDLIDGAATAGALVFPATVTVQTAIYRACSIAAPAGVTLIGVGQWRTIGSSLPGI